MEESKPLNCCTKMNDRLQLSVLCTLFLCRATGLWLQPMSLLTAAFTFLNPIILTDTVIKEKTESRKKEPTNVFKLLQSSGLSTAQNLKKCCLLSHKPNLRPTEERRCSLTCSVAWLLVCATVCSWPASGYTNLFGLPIYIYLKLLSRHLLLCFTATFFFTGQPFF